MCTPTGKFCTYAGWPTPALRIAALFAAWPGSCTDTNAYFYKEED